MKKKQNYKKKSLIKYLSNLRQYLYDIHKRSVELHNEDLSEEEFAKRVEALRKEWNDTKAEYLKTERRVYG